jgi:chromate transporter
VVGVILNLAVWFALHTLFGEVEDFSRFGAIWHLPIIATINWPAVALSLVAVLALFRLKLGMIPTLGLCSALGLLITTIWNP